MIVSIGEILADMIGEEQDGVTAFKMYGGGAPFNVAVNAKRAGRRRALSVVWDGIWWERF